MRGQYSYPMRATTPGVIALPFSFETDGAGAVVAGTGAGDGYTVAAATAGTGRYVFTLTGRYKELLSGNESLAFGSSVQGVQGEIVDAVVNSATPTITVAAMQKLSAVRMTPAVLDTDGVHAAYAGDNAVLDMTAGIIAGHAAIMLANPRCVTATFAAAWDGGDIVFTGVEAITGLPATETITAAVGTTVSSVNAYSSVTAVAKTLLGLAADTVQIGYGDAMSMLAYLENNVVVALVAAIPEANTVAGHLVTATTATGAAAVFTYIGNFKRPTAILSGRVFGCFFLQGAGSGR